MAPIIQILAMIIGFIILTLELPLPQLKGLSIYRSWVVRIVLLSLQAFFAILFYQVRRFGRHGASNIDCRML